ncbi:hypothetical protein BCV69DRAFT_246906 [Microstroma glucosiphilum]|uniref:ferric-chelate reductase (NADPH) n=1 Tax=Pseudomicrostroma glucosiphilum TaxID=1684307 RepID=A0A316UEZ2_9BASI|nr:hypothetical protein BCV69DRAFT_246906 [Pseudomicrostroma glucosiphilum]PWN21695.1 hypothetical protein BCV69DRAFT_246906 [Pseudomicrostroma glucosiphilum]
MSVYVPPATNSGSSCSGSCQTEDDLKYAYIGNYLGAHMLSTPSHRYAYIMWFTIVGLLLLGSAIHHAGIGDQTWVGAYWTKFAPKGRLIKLGKKPQQTVRQAIATKRWSKEGKSAAAAGPKGPSKPAKRYVFSLPSFGKILLVACMVAIPVVLSLVGADYINPNESMFNMAASWPSRSSAPMKSIARRDVPQWGIGNYVPLDTTVAYYNLPYHTWWTSGGRFGLMTNALTPFVVILALKQVPWAVMSTKLFGRYAFEKMSFLHKWGGRLVWVFASAHTIAWSVQLRLDERNGEEIWGFIFLWPKFRWAFVAMGFLTLLTILSIGPIRTHYYEWFYVGHIICGIGFMVATALHHPPLAGWMWASLTWWGAERITRALKVAYINGIGFAGRKPEAQSLSSAPSLQDVSMVKGGFPGPQYGPPQNQAQFKNVFPAPQEYVPHLAQGGHRHRGTIDSTGGHTQSSATLYEPSVASHNGPHGIPKGSNGYSHPLDKSSALEQDYIRAGNAGARATLGPGEEDEWDLDEDGDKVRKRPSRRYGPVSELIKEYAARPMSNIQEDSASPHKYAHGVDPLTSNISSYDDSTDLADHYAHSRDHGDNVRPQGFELSDQTFAPPPSGTLFPPPLPVARPVRPALPADVAAIIKPGYAFAQVLPGKTLRLTLRTPNRMSWQPGQWVYLNIPGISGWQSHPFTIASAHDAHMPDVSSRRKKGGPSDLEAGVVKVKGEERTMVLLIRARKGFTLKLWEHVKKHRHRQVTAAAQPGRGSVSGTLGKTTTGVHVRAIVDGAYGSTERVRWGIHSTILLVCGGSGISFGISVLEHLCACLKEVNETGKTNRGGKNFSVQRIRFVWVCREFSHLQWVASALRRCIEMIPPKQLQVDLYVTHINNQMARSGGPRNQRPSLGGSYGGSQMQLSQTGLHTPNGSGTATPSGGEPEAWRDAQGNVYHRPAYVGGREAEEMEMEPNEFTEFDEDDMVEPDADEMAINTRIRDEGKLRRAHTKRLTLKRKGRRASKGGSEAMIPEVSHDAVLAARNTAAMAAQDAMYHRASTGHSFLQNQPGQQGRSRPDASLYPMSGSRRPQAPRADSSFLAPYNQDSGMHTPNSGTHTPDPLAPGSRRGSLPSNVGHGGEWSDSGIQTPFGHNVYDSFARRSSAHLLGTESEHHGGALGPSGGGEGLDSAIDLDEEEEQDLRIIAELAHMGHPRLDQIIGDETKYAQGRTLVASCGPGNLSNLLRRIAVKHVDPARSRKGDKRGEVNLCMESFEWGGS